jgi:drug/metabolite transporter (DMT)-like permease
MIIGGMVTALVGVALGETSQLTTDRLTWAAALSFFYLLIVGSLIGFVAFNWLLGHVSANMVGTYAYVNPLVAILVGWLLGGEDMTVRILAGVSVILFGVALVRGGGMPPRSTTLDHSGRVAPQQGLESRLLKVMVKSESPPDSLPFHDYKRNAIGQ